VSGEPPRSCGTFLVTVRSNFHRLGYRPAVPCSRIIRATRLREHPTSCPRSSWCTRGAPSSRSGLPVSGGVGRSDEPVGLEIGVRPSGLLLVVEGGEEVEEGLELVEGGWLGGWARSELSIVCWKRSTSPQVTPPQSWVTAWTRRTTAAHGGA
jgi:hypothetical protein